MLHGAWVHRLSGRHVDNRRLARPGRSDHHRRFHRDRPQGQSGVDQRLRLPHHHQAVRQPYHTRVRQSEVQLRHSDDELHQDEHTRLHSGIGRGLHTHGHVHTPWRSYRRLARPAAAARVPPQQGPAQGHQLQVRPNRLLRPVGAVRHQELHRQQHIEERHHLRTGRLRQHTHAAPPRVRPRTVP